MPVRAPVALNTDRPHVGKEHNGALPDLGIQPRRGQFLTGDGVGITQDFETVSGDLTHDTDAKTGPRKGLATDDDLGKPQLAADGAYLVFEEGAKGLDEVELEVFGQPTDVVVALDVGGSSPAAGLDHIRIEGALHEEADGFAVGLGLIHEFALDALERADELATDDLALLFGVADSGERVEERLARVDGHEAHTGRGHVVLLHLLALALAQQAVVDEHGNELVADCLVNEGRRDSRVDSARQRREHPTRADLRADPIDLLGDDVAAVPVCGEARSLVQEVLDNALPVVGVLDLGMPLHTVHAASVVPESGDRGGTGAGKYLEPGGGFGHLVTMAHPDVLLRGLAIEQYALVTDDAGVSRPVLAQPRVRNDATERLRHDLESVADAKGRNAQVEHRRVERRRAGLVHR